MDVRIDHDGCDTVRRPNNLKKSTKLIHFKNMFHNMVQ